MQAGAAGGAAGGGAAPAHGEPTAEVEVTIECHGLRNMDTFSKSDPMAIVYAQTGDSWTQVGVTETVWDNLNPKFSKSFVLRYYFERTQLYKFEVYDVDDEQRRMDLSRQDLIGVTAPLALGEIVATAGGKSVPLLARDGRELGHGTLTVEGTEQQGGNDVAHLTLRGEGLAALDWFGSSDPILVIHRGSGDGRWVKVWESAPIKANVNPRWKPFSIPVRKLCVGDASRPLLLEILDWERSGAHRPIGYHTTTLDTLTALTRGQPIPLRHPQGKEKDVGSIVVDRATVEAMPSFVDYLKGGCEVSLMIAVDFTASNGDPKTQQSLHHLWPEHSGRRNDYQATIETVGGILAAYDADGLVPAFGFGARFPNGQVSHCFNLNGQAAPECNGIPDVLHFYQQAVLNLQLYGPTNFSEFIEMAAKIARDANVGEENQEYYVLMVATDGVITDMQQTISSIVNASDLPLSIVIVGVGNADFDKMDVLDADDTPLRCQRTRRVMQRDIVQFVPYRDFKHAGVERLAEEVLAEIPEQLLSFFKSKHIQPGGGWTPPAPAPAPSAAGGLMRTASGRMISAERSAQQAALGGTYEQGVTLNAMEAELCRVRAMIAQQGAKDGVSHEGWLGVEGPPGADWERRFGRICMRETGAVLQLGLDEQRRVQADAQQWAEVPLTTSVVPRPWPKSRREVAPNAFRITVPEGSLAELALPIADPQQAKLILDPGTADDRDAWMHALNAALAVAPAPAASGGAAGAQIVGARSSMSTGGLVISVPTVSIEQDAAGNEEPKYHVQCFLSTTGNTATALRTYDDFVTMRVALLALKPGVGLPDLPRRRLFHAMTLTPAVMEERREAFQHYLQSVALMPAFSGERVFRNFVGLA